MEIKLTNIEIWILEQAINEYKKLAKEGKLTEVYNYSLESLETKLQTAIAKERAKREDEAERAFFKSHPELNP